MQTTRHKSIDQNLHRVSHLLPLFILPPPPTSSSANSGFCISVSAVCSARRPTLSSRTRSTWRGGANSGLSVMHQPGFGKLRCRTAPTPARPHVSTWMIAHTRPPFPTPPHTLLPFHAPL